MNRLTIARRLFGWSLVAMLSCLSATAQRKMVVVDIETLIPINGVNITSREGTITSDSLGHFSVPDSCRSLAFSHVNYESRIVNMEEVNDTVFLISKLLNVKEVVVFGQAPYKDDYKNLQQQMTPSKADLQWAAVQPGDGINLLGLVSYLIPEKWKKSRKERRKERQKRILDNY